MKRWQIFTLCGALALGFLSAVQAEAKDVQVQGYTRKDGTVVAPYMRTAPDSTVNNNFSTRGNVNPYTGREGTKPPEPSYGYTNPYSGSASLYGTPKPAEVPNYNSGISPYIDPAPLPPSNGYPRYGR
jgi:hypothetical protein